MRWNFHVSPPWTMVWPALLPPWKRTTTSARSASRSMTLPLPSSPHWAPTITVPGIAVRSVGGGPLRLVPASAERRRFGRLGLDQVDLDVASQVGAQHGDGLAHLLEPGDRPRADLL